MERSDYSLLSLSVWFIASQIASGWFADFALAVAVGWTIVYVLALFNAYRDKKAASRIETWRR